jgi:hypothetical protein
MGSSSKSVDPTPEQLALEKRTLIGLEEEARSTERMLKAQARGKIGVRSLLQGIKPNKNLINKITLSDAPSLEDMYGSSKKSNRSIKYYHNFMAGQKE